MKMIEIVIEGELPINCLECDAANLCHGCDRLCGVCMQCGLVRPKNCPLVAWQSSESAPKDGNEFLIAFPGMEEAICAAWFADEIYPVGQEMWQPITDPGWQWRPMPKTPEVKE